jgi:DNA-directed RNA polymerase subunit RPC12/RpoP
LLLLLTETKQKKTMSEEHTKAVTVKRKANKKSGYTLKEKEGSYYVADAPARARVNPGDEVVAINGIKSEEFIDEADANELIECIRIVVIPEAELEEYDKKKQAEEGKETQDEEEEDEEEEDEEEEAAPPPPPKKALSKNKKDQVAVIPLVIPKKGAKKSAEPPPKNGKAAKAPAKKGKKGGGEDDDEEYEGYDRLAKPKPNGNKSRGGDDGKKGGPSSANAANAANALALVPRPDDDEEDEHEQNQIVKGHNGDASHQCTNCGHENDADLSEDEDGDLVCEECGHVIEPEGQVSS